MLVESDFCSLGEDTTMRFSLTPCSGEKGFQQWKDAISVAIRMPGGLPPSIRQKVIHLHASRRSPSPLLAMDIPFEQLHPGDTSGLEQNLSIRLQQLLKP